MKRLIAIVMSVVMLFSAMALPVGAVQTLSETSGEKENTFLDNMINAFSFFKYGINDTRVHLRPTGRENISEFCIDYTDNSGAEKENALGAYYNELTGEVFGFNYDRGVFDSGFAYNALSNQFYATKDCWQRDLGFTPLYDLLAKLAFNYVTRRFFFEYEGKEWMIQIWKGNYAFNLLVGGEVGIYNRPEGRLGWHYDCVTDEEMMPISMKVYSAERSYIDREELVTWWQTGFVFADPVRPKSLTMESSITFPSEEMCNAFMQSTKMNRDVICTQNGATVSFVW